MSQFVLTPCDLSKIENEAMIDNKLQVMPFAFYEQFTENEIKFFMHKYGIYVLPTTELIDWLRNNITGISIEIGAGHGAISRKLGIPITDSRMQERKEIQLMYLASGQPVIKYSDDIEKLDAEQAIKKYKPNTVIGAFVTHKFNGVNGNHWGVDLKQLIKSVDKYIHIGNLTTHKDYGIYNSLTEQHYFDWLITRSFNQEENRIFVWSKQK